MLWEMAEILTVLGLLARLAFAGRREQRAEICAAILLGNARRRHRSGWPSARLATGTAAVSLFYIIAPRAMAQQEPRVLTPVEMFDPEAGPGVPVGSSFVLHPELTVREAYDSNIYNVDTGARHDFITAIRPRLLLRSTFPRHELEFTGDADIRRYARTSDENSEQYDVAAGGKLELAERIDVAPDVGYSRGIEQRGTAGDQFVTDRPVVYNQKYAGLAISRLGAQLELVVDGRYTRTDYDNSTSLGVPVDNSYRNVEIGRGRVNASLALSPRLRLFAELGGNKVHYLVSTGSSRDSIGYSALVGVHLQITSLIDLEAAAGYIHQHFDDPSFRTVSGANFRLIANWTPTPDWRITADAERVIDRSPRTDVPAIVRSDFDLGAQRALGSRMLVEGHAEFVEEKYWGIQRVDHRYEARLAVHYRLTKRIGIIGGAGYRKQNGGAFGRSYEGGSVSIGVNVSL